MLNPISTLYRSLTDPQVYKEVSRNRFFSVLVYLLIYYLAFALILSGYLSIRYYSTTRQAIEETLAIIKSTYPPNLSLNLVNSELNVSGATEPVVLNAPHFAITIDTTGSTSATLTSNIPSLLASKSSLKFSFPDMETPLIIPYSQFSQSGKLDSISAQKYLEVIQSSLKDINLFTVISGLTLGILLFYLPERLIYTLITAGLFYLLGRLTTLPIKFVTYLKIVLTVLVAAESLNLITTLIYGHPTPIVFTVAFLGYTFVAIYTVQKSLQQK